MAGYSYDVLGRRFTLMVGMVLQITACATTPLFSQIYPDLLINKCIFSLGLMICFSNPLIADYAMKESRGLAQSHVRIDSSDL